MKNKMTTSELKQYVIAEAKRLHKIEVLKEQKSKIDKELKILSEDYNLYDDESYLDKDLNTDKEEISPNGLNDNQAEANRIYYQMQDDGYFKKMSDLDKKMHILQKQFLTYQDEMFEEIYHLAEISVKYTKEKEVIDTLAFHVINSLAFWLSDENKKNAKDSFIKFANRELKYNDNQASSQASAN